MNETTLMFSDVVKQASTPPTSGMWVSRNWQIAYDTLKSIDEKPSCIVVDVIGLLLDMLEDKRVRRSVGEPTYTKRDGRYYADGVEFEPLELIPELHRQIVDINLT